MEELLEYDIESILLNRVRDVFPYLQKVIGACDSLFNDVSNSVKEERARKNDYMTKAEHNAATIADLSSQIKDITDESPAIVLQQKVVEKEIYNTTERQENIRDEIEAGKAKEESLVLAIVDLQEEINGQKEKKKRKWNAIKRGLQMYKSALQIYIEMIESTEICDKIRIKFKFSQDDEHDYYVDLTRTLDLWQVENIHPLNEKYEERLKCVVNYKKNCQVSNITAFLCILRKLLKENRKV